MDNEVEYNMESSSSHESTREKTAAPPPDGLVDSEKNITSKTQKLVTEKKHSNMHELTPTTVFPSTSASDPTPKITHETSV